MSKSRRIAALSLLAVLALAACGPSTASGEPTTAPSSAPSAAAPSEAAGASPSDAPSVVPSAAAADDLTAAIPDTVGDVALSATQTDADAYIIANVGRRLGPALTALGKTPADVTVATATGASPAGATLFIDAVRVAGADAAAVLAAVQTAAEALPGGQVATSEVAGRPVVTVTAPSYTLAVTASGDTLFYVQSPDPALVEAALGALS